jgi:predicted metal-dependent peptidase|tara:strand:- start:907 stop:2100 length:1194 start_codon:yes stop_codon:yes gene_type:complete
MREKSEADVQIQRVKKSRARLYSEAPGTYMMMAGLPIEVSNQIDTFATDGKKVLVNVNFCKSIPDLNVSGIMIHESLHISLKHMYRRPEWCCHALWNEATDYVINGWIYESENYGKSFSLPKNCLNNKKYWGWAAEKVAKDLLDNGWEEPPEGTDTRVRPGDVMDAEEEGDDLIEAEEELDERIADASLLEKSVGRGKGGMMTKIADQVGKTSTSEHIRHWLQTRYTSPNKSLARPNRRFVHKKIYLPTPKKQVERLHVCIDSSASVGKSELADYRAQIVRYAKELGLNVIRVAYVDSRIHENKIDGGIWHDIVLDGASPDSIELNVHGGGGTSFDPIFNRVEEEGEEVTALVYMTDGYGSVSVNEPTYPVLWLSSGCEPDFYRTSRWGKHVSLSYY